MPSWLCVEVILLLNLSDSVRAAFLKPILFCVVQQSVLELLFIMMHLSFIFATGQGVEGKPSLLVSGEQQSSFKRFITIDWLSSIEYANVAANTLMQITD